MTTRITIILLFAIFLAVACTQDDARNANDIVLYNNTVDIEYGTDMCSFSKKPIETVRYGGKITLMNGDVHKFMSVECTAGFYLGMDDKSTIKQIEIVDFAHGQQYLPVDELVFLQSKLRPSPNGLFLTAIDNSNTKMKQYIYDAYPGTFMSWEEVLVLVQEEWDLSGASAMSSPF
jgi:hypothetical protein